MKLKNPKVQVPDSLKDEVEIVETNSISGATYNDEPDVFYFTNASNEDWSTQWNKIKYTFPKQKTVRMVIMDETPQNIQNIRKMFAYRFAQDQFLKSDKYKELVALGKGVATTYDEKLLQPWIDQCLKPLEKAKVQIEKIEDNPEAVFRGSKAVGQNASLNYEFREDADAVVGH